MLHSWQSVQCSGVAILFNNNFEYEVLSSIFDTDGNYICLTLKITTMTIHIMTLYAPNIDNPAFFSEVQDILKEHPADYYIICGDFNLVLDPHMDSYNYKHLNNPKARSSVLNMMT